MTAGLHWSAEHNGYVDSSGQPVERRRSLSWGYRSAIFVSIVLLLNVAWSSASGTPVERLMIDRITVVPATFLINHLTPDVAARAMGWSIKAHGGGLNIRVGCDGLELAFLTIAAFLVAPMAWSRRLTGLIIGLAIVYALNQGRILTLFYVNRLDKSLFDLLHTTVLPLFLIVLVAIYFYAWLVYDQRLTTKPR